MASPTRWTWVWVSFGSWWWIGKPGREGSGTPLQYSCLENPMDRGAWWAAVHGVAKNRTRLSNFTFTFHFHALEKEMATQSSVLAWRIPGMGEPGGLLSMGSHRVGHDWSDLAAAAAGKPGVLQSMGSQSPTWLSDWTDWLWLLRYFVITLNLPVVYEQICVTQSCAVADPSIVVSICVC